MRSERVLRASESETSPPRGEACASAGGRFPDSFEHYGTRNAVIRSKCLAVMESRLPHARCRLPVPAPHVRRTCMSHMPEMWPLAASARSPFRFSSRPVFMSVEGFVHKHDYALTLTLESRDTHSVLVRHRRRVLNTGASGVCATRRRGERHHASSHLAHGARTSAVRRAYAPSASG